MAKTTDLDRVKEIAVDFLNMPIQQTDIDFVVSHPFTNSIAGYDGKNMLNLSDSNDLQAWRDKYTERILNADNIQWILFMMNKAYYLAFLKYIRPFTARTEFDTLLSSVWNSIEQISLDCNVDARTLVQWWKTADKKLIMSEKEYNDYLKLPDNVTLYRGVTDYNKGAVHALSWTYDKEQAFWFAKRYNTFKKSQCYIWSITVPKERVLAVFDYEHEVLVNTFDFNGIVACEIVSQDGTINKDKTSSFRIS